MPATMFGDWGRAVRALVQARVKVRRAMETGLRQACAQTERAVVLHIQKQDLAWQALSPRYLARKVAKGLSEQIYIATSSYIQSVTSRVDAMRLIGAVGVARSAVRKDGELFEDIPATLEFGSKDGTIPPRPLWRPTFREMLPKVRALLLRKVREAARP